VAVAAGVAWTRPDVLKEEARSIPPNRNMTATTAIAGYLEYVALKRPVNSFIVMTSFRLSGGGVPHSGSLPFPVDNIHATN
jgi:hypothetical protein